MHSMNCFRSFLLLAVLTCAVVAVAQAQTNKVKSFVLPPEDWNASKHVLISIVTTNVPGSYKLPTIWSGEERVTARTGWFRGDFVLRRDATNDWLTATNFELLADSVLSRRFGKRQLDLVSGDGRALAAYRQSLPSDSALLAITNTTSVSNLLGWNPFLNVTNASTIRVRFFSLRPYDSIESLYVTFFVRRENPDTIHSTLVKRGKLHPQSFKR